MWFGTYPSVPTYVMSTGEVLQDFVKKNPQLVGKSVLDRFGAEIPFLPKVQLLERNEQIQAHGVLDPILF